MHGLLGHLWSYFRSFIILCGKRVETTWGIHDDDAPLATKVLSALCSPARNYIRASLSFLIISQIAHMSKSRGKSMPHIHLWVRPSEYVMRNNLIINWESCNFQVHYPKEGKTLKRATFSNDIVRDFAHSCHFMQLRGASFPFARGGQGRA